MSRQSRSAKAMVRSIRFVADYLRDSQNPGEIVIAASLDDILDEASCAREKRSRILRMKAEERLPKSKRGSVRF